MRPFAVELQDLEHGPEARRRAGLQLGELLGFKLGPVEHFSDEPRHNGFAPGRP